MTKGTSLSTWLTITVLILSIPIAAATNDGTTKASKSHFANPPCETIVAGDLNGDCVIDFRDVFNMALHWCEDNNP